jgi:isocitrate dehydrogenase kinase/phosphatase
MIHPAKRDFGTLRTAQIVNAGLTEFEAAPSDAEKAEALARIILGAFDDYYTRSRRIPWLAKRAFETRDWPRAIELSQERIAIFSVSIDKVVPILKRTIQQSDQTGGFWDTVEARFRGLVAKRYEADLALAYLASVRRRVHEDVWTPTPYRRAPGAGIAAAPPGFLHRFDPPGRMTAELAEAILKVPGIEAPFRDLAGDAKLVAERINAELEIGPNRPLTRVEVVEAGFYRNRGAYIVGALEVAGETGPLALALLHREGGVEVDAVILRETTLRHVFSSTLANFHVTVTAYHELVDFLFALMPDRPRGMHYSTVGYNHVGKLAVMEQITKGLVAGGGEGLDHAPGPRGSVAMALTTPGMDYVLKVIRDQPTADYKWGHFAGVDSVLAKYDRVHELNRSGSMLDNIIYSNLSLPRAMFRPAVLDEMLADARQTVSLHDGPRGTNVFFRHLIVQRKLVPVPLYLESCTRREAEMVVIRLGQCIRNNAATNVFNKDLDGRNYGVSTLRFVYLFDYDAVEQLTDVKVRTNLGREDGEEDIPEWFFEDGIIFLPEEMEAHLRLPDRDLVRLFRAAHGELLTVEYWTRMQRWLREGRVPRVRTYPRATQLRLEGAEGNLILSPAR